MGKFNRRFIDIGSNIRANEPALLLSVISALTEECVESLDEAPNGGIQTFNSIVRYTEPLKVSDDAGNEMALSIKVTMDKITSTSMPVLIYGSVSDVVNNVNKEKRENLRASIESIEIKDPTFIAKIEKFYLHYTRRPLSLADYPMTFIEIINEFINVDLECLSILLLNGVLTKNKMLSQISSETLHVNEFNAMNEEFVLTCIINGTEVHFSNGIGIILADLEFSGNGLLTTASTEIFLPEVAKRTAKNDAAFLNSIIIK